MNEQTLREGGMGKLILKSEWKEGKRDITAQLSATNILMMGYLGGSAVRCLPSPQGAILETRDRIPRRAPGAWSLLLLCLCLCLILSLSVTITNK